MPESGARLRSCMALNKQNHQRARGGSRIPPRFVTANFAALYTLLAPQAFDIIRWMGRIAWPNRFSEGKPVRIVISLVTASLAAAVPEAVIAHPGGLNSEGCHNNWKTGDYHCHRASASANRGTVKTLSGNRAFRNCSEARAAGAAPVRRGDPSYGPHLDRDNDGVGCE